MDKPILHNQSIIDFTIHRCGKFEQLVKMAVLNGICFTDTIAVNTSLKVPQDGNDNQIIEFFENKNHVPANLANQTNFHNDYGIGSMIIEDSFIIH